MDWNLVDKGKDGELTINMWWACLLVVFVGFLFGLGFSSGYYIIDTLLNNDGFYLYYLLREFKILILAFLVFLTTYLIIKNKEDKKK